MPPKAAGGGGAAAGAKKKKTKTAPYNPVDDIKGMHEVDEALAKQMQLRNYFQVERDKVYELWEVSKRELERDQYRLTNAESELEEMERAHQVEMKVYKQKVRHLLYDQKVKLKQMKDDSDHQLQQAELRHEKAMADIQSETAKRTKDLVSEMEVNEANVLEHRDTHQYMVSVTKRQNHEKELARLKASYEAKLTTLREDLELRRRAEVNDTEEHWNGHINALIHQHESKFAEMKTYYNSITKNNLEIIQSLKDEIAAMKKNDAHNESLMYDIEKENHNLGAPLEQAERDVAELQLKKKQHLQDKQSLSMTRGRLRTLQQDVKTLREKHRQLEQDYKRVYDEREELRVKFEFSLREAMDVVEERNASLYQHLVEANARVEERDAQLDGVLMAMGLEPSTMQLVSAEVEQELAIKNQVIKDLYFELRKLEERSGALMTEYERRCRVAGLPLLSRENFAPV